MSVGFTGTIKQGGRIASAQKTQRFTSAVKQQRFASAVKTGNSGSGGSYSSETVTGTTHNETAASGIKILLCDCTGGAITVNLPTAVNNKALIIVKKVDSSSNTVTIDGSGAETIDGNAQVQLTRQNTSLTMSSNNENWFIH